MISQELQNPSEPKTDRPAYRLLATFRNLQMAFEAGLVTVDQFLGWISDLSSGERMKLLGAIEDQEARHVKDWAAV